MLYSECVALGYTKYDGSVVHQFLNQVRTTSASRVQYCTPGERLYSCALPSYVQLMFDLCKALYSPPATGVLCCIVLSCTQGLVPCLARCGSCLTCKMWSSSASSSPRKTTDRGPCSCPPPLKSVRPPESTNGYALGLQHRDQTRRQYAVSES